MSKLGEPIATNIIRILAAAMPPILTKIKNEYQTIDGASLQPGNAERDVPLPPIKKFYFGQRLNTPEFPCVIVDPRSMHIDAERFHFQWADYDHAIHIDVLVMGDNEDIVSRQLLRYVRAVWEVLFGNQIDVFGNQVAVISLRPVAGAATELIKDKQMLFRGYKLVLEAHRYDDLT